jgi:hypothetical protein
LGICGISEFGEGRGAVGALADGRGGGGGCAEVGLMLVNGLAASALAASNVARSHDWGAPRVKALNFAAPADTGSFWAALPYAGRCGVFGGGGNGNCCLVGGAGLVGAAGFAKP